MATEFTMRNDDVKENRSVKMNNFMISICIELMKKQSDMGLN